MLAAVPRSRWQNMVPFGLVLLAALPRASGQCTGVTAPANGALGDCPPDGTLADGGWCLLTCNSGFRLTGGQPSCARSASGQCPLAEDSGTFTDAQGQPCTGWAQANRPGQTCAEAGAGWGYSAADVELVTRFCPVTCEAVPAACSSEEGTAALLANCPLSCDVCPLVTDTATLPTFERCCDTAISPEGDASCFDNLFTFDVCCPTKEGAHEM